MNGMRLILASAADVRRIEAVESFVGEDASGQFGVLPGHARLMTPLAFGLARYRVAGGDWQYLATTGGVLDTDGEEIRIATRRFLIDADYATLSAALDAELAQESAAIQALHQSLQRIEEGVVRRLWELRRSPAGLP